MRSLLETTYQLGLPRHAAPAGFASKIDPAVFCLRGDQLRLLRRRQILREVLFDAFWREQEKSVRLRLQLVEASRFREALADFADRLAGIWCKMPRCTPG